jgi:hypothetical protein
MKSFLLLATLLSVAATTAVADTEVAYPAGYRDWHHLKSMVIQEGHPLFAAFGGIHHLYANPLAMQGYKAGKFPDGSVIVFDLLDVQAADNALTEGARKVVGVMHKDSKKFAATGGWGFEGFAAGNSNKRAVGANAATACFACHEAQKDRDFVFSAARAGE